MPVRIRLLAAIAVALLLAAGTPALAQDIRPAPGAADDEPVRILHVTDRLNSTPEAIRSLHAFHADRNAGIARTSAIAYTVGMSASFRVLKNLASNPIWESREFELMASSDIANIWVETNELAMEHVTDADIASLNAALLQQTPAGSVDPTKGIIANNYTYFGAPPNVDGDNRLDILLYDIEEGEGAGNVFVAGYVTSSDLSTFGGGNNKDILYLDTDPGLTTRPVTEILSTAAHEHQHLIHFNYDLNELTFVNEGLSEWAEVLNGYLPRPMTYLLDPAVYNVGLLSWDESVSIVDDYRRAGLFTAYLAERLGNATTAAITRSTERGRNGYSSVLTSAGLDFEEVVLDFHTANYLNIPRVQARFGYQHPNFATITTVPSAVVDGREIRETPLNTFNVAPGAAVYYTWTDVQNFSLSLDTSDPLATVRSRMKARIVKEAPDGAITYEDLDLPLTDRLFSGTFESLTLQMTHTRPELSARVGVGMAASWSTDLAGSIVSTAFDDGSAISGTFFSLSSAEQGAVATRFDAPQNSQLLEVAVAPYYLNQFSGSGLSVNENRDLELRIWAVGTNGQPGDLLFSKTVVDPRAYTGALLTLNHFTIDLEDDADALQNLPDTYFIGYGETGTDVNFMIVGPSTYAAENRSFIRRGDGTWGALWDTQFQDGGDDEFPLRGSVVPIRATFLVAQGPVANEDDPSLPAATVLHQNFPNPFNPSTTIRYELADASHVRLTVYDLLGRPVQRLVDGMLPAGRHQIAFDAESLASGLYLYTLDTGTTVETRRMMLVK